MLKMVMLEDQQVVRRVIHVVVVFHHRHRLPETTTNGKMLSLISHDVELNQTNKQTISRLLSLKTNEFFHTVHEFLVVNVLN